METERRKWDLSNRHVVRFYSPTEEISDSDSFFDADQENSLTPDTSFQKNARRTPIVQINCADQDKKITPDSSFQKSCLRTPLVQINQNREVAELRRDTLCFERHKRTKSCPLKKIYSAKKKRSRPSHDYYLRQTPTRLSRAMANLQDDYESDEYIDANEFMHGSPSNMQDVRHLGNRSIYMTSTAKRPSSGQHRGSYEEMVPKDKRKSYVIPNPMLTGEDYYENNTDVLQFREVSPAASRRSSYTVRDSKFSPSEIPSTPTLRRSPRIAAPYNLDSQESVFEVQYANQNVFKSTKNEGTNKKARNNRAVPQRNTVFQPFNLKTNERCPKRDFNPVSETKNFTSTLRHNTPRGKAKSPRLTKMSPFHFGQSRKRPHEDDCDEEDYKPLAERVAAHFKTPTRYRTVPRHTVFKPTGKRYSPRRVIPHSPNLQAVKRKRAPTVLSHDEQMDLEAQQIKEYQFHARPFNPNLVNHPHTLKVQKKPPTKPEPMELETEKRVLTRRQFQNQAEEPKYEFHAQKIPKGILKGPMGLKATKQQPLTHPKSPNFALKNREEKWKSFCVVDTSEAGVFRFKAKPAPIPKSPQVAKRTRRATSIQPFSFDQKDTERFTKKRMKIQEEIEKENMTVEFHAKEVPAAIFTPRPMRHVQKKPSTIPQPFNISTVRNKSIDTSKIQTQPLFKAKPATVLKKEPFIPHKSLKPLSECFELNLNTENRAVAREKLKEERMSAYLEKEEAAQRYMEEEEQREKEELRQLRKQLVHKAQPVPTYKPMHIKPSDKELTSAQSPQFASDQRLRRKSD